jgi:hypothetical protein
VIRFGFRPFEGGFPNGSTEGKSMQTVPNINTRIEIMPTFGSFNPPKMKVDHQRKVEFALMAIIAIVLPIVCVLQA